MDHDIPAPTESDSAPGSKRKPLPPGVWITLGLIVFVTFPVWGWFLYQGWAWVDLREDRRRMGLMQEEAILVTAPPGAELVEVLVDPAEWNFGFLVDDPKDFGPVPFGGSVFHSFAPVVDLAEVAGFYVDLLSVGGWEFRRLVCRYNDEDRFSIRAEKRLDGFVVEASLGANLSSGSASVFLTAPFHTQERRDRGSGFSLEGDCSSFGIPNDFTPP